mmetsp:Transcript_32569/g.32888  ORF Transcript_32569/g.32888 Transcript_32569/m.32888 type:complete len:100 (-) Transcript_32569:584-883(-)
MIQFLTQEHFPDSFPNLVQLEELMEQKIAGDKVSFILSVMRIGGVKLQEIKQHNLAIHGGVANLYADLLKEVERLVLYNMRVPVISRDVMIGCKTFESH